MLAVELEDVLADTQIGHLSAKWRSFRVLLTLQKQGMVVTFFTLELLNVVLTVASYHWHFETTVAAFGLTKNVTRLLGLCTRADERENVLFYTSI